jgi:tetratricopeptide (TPR) repeat protein
MGRHEEARHAYAQAVAADPRLCEASYNLGALAEDLGDLTQAIAHYRAALRLAPDYADAHFNLAGALVRAGRPDEATPHWQRYLQLDAGSPWSRIARAHLERPE